MFNIHIFLLQYLPCWSNTEKYCVLRMTYAYYVWGITDVDLQVLTNADGTSNPAEITGLLNYWTSNPAASCATLMTRATESSSKQKLGIDAC